jgi:lipoate-protein ligase B
VARILEVRRLGRTDYAATHALQEELVAERLAGTSGDVLILTEHEPVITLGRGAKPEALETAGVPVVEVERGGDATYHGPGQLVAYPIYLLPEGRRDLHRYLRDLEEVVIRMLAEVEVEGTRRPGATGVWVGDKKLASIGVAVRRWVAWHGLSLNLFTDLAAYQRFRPCGLDPAVMGRLCDLVDLPPANLLFEVLCVKHFCEVFDLELPPVPRRPPGEGRAGGASTLPIWPG